MGRLTRNAEGYVDVILSLTPRTLAKLDEKTKEYGCSRSSTIALLLSGYPKDKPYSLEELVDKVIDMQISMSNNWDEHRNETINLIKDIISREKEKTNGK